MEKRMVQNLLHKDLSYQIHGAAIEVRKDFGPGHKEKLYQKAFEEELMRRKISFEKEKAIKIYSPKDGKYIGLYRPDFIVDEKIIIEIKAEKFVSREEIKRIYDYLRNGEYELAYLINFVSPRLFVRRIIYTNDRKPFIKNLLVSIGLILALFGGLGAEAAQLDIVSQTQEINVGQQFQVDVVLNTEGEQINAIEGKIVFPDELLEVKEIRDGNSIVNFWIEKPHIPPIDANINTNRHQQVVFSGITPGGYQGTKGLIFSMIFEAKKGGAGSIEIQEAKTLINDGKGTEAELKIFNFQFNIKEVGLPKEVRLPEIKDIEPPETFKPEIASDPAIFEGKWFLVFATQDKGSGIDHYEVRETRQWVGLENLLPFVKQFRRHSWIAAESPYVLKDQSLRSWIYVKATDKAGNERIVSLAPRYSMKWYERYEIWVIIIILGLVIVYMMRKFLWRKKIIHNVIHK